MAFVPTEEQQKTLEYFGLSCLEDLFEEDANNNISFERPKTKSTIRNQQPPMANENTMLNISRVSTFKQQEEHERRESINDKVDIDDTNLELNSEMHAHGAKSTRSTFLKKSAETAEKRNFRLVSTHNMKINKLVSGPNSKPCSSDEIDSCCAAKKKKH